MSGRRTRMTGFLGKLFGSKKKKAPDGLQGFVEVLLSELIELSRWDLAIDVYRDEKTGDVNVEFTGDDEELLISKEGQLLDSLQLFVRRAAQHQLPDEEGNINLDCANFREQANDALIA